LLGYGPFKWLDHVIRAYQRFDERNGSFFAAGLTYYSIFALFPLLMVVSRRWDLRCPVARPTAHDRQPYRGAVSNGLGQQLVDLMNSAIRARASVGIIGLATAAWAGLAGCRTCGSVDRDVVGGALRFAGVPGATNCLISWRSCGRSW